MSAQKRTMTGFSALLAALAAALLLSAAFAGKAEAEVPIYDFSIGTHPAKAGEDPNKAGGHPNLVTRFQIGNFLTEPPKLCRCRAPREITINAPAGAIAIADLTPRCTATEFANFDCPTDSQVGVARIRLETPEGSVYVMPVFNMVPGPDEPSRLATPTPVFGTPIFTVFSPRTESDWGLEAVTSGITRLQPVYDFAQIFWGVPADPVHNFLREPLGGHDLGSFGARPGYFCGTRDPLEDLIDDVFGTCADANGIAPVQTPPNTPEVPFYTNPSTCVGPQTARIETFSYEGDFDNATAPFPAMGGCDQLGFGPSLAGSPTTSDADSPSGLEVRLEVEQSLSPDVPSPSTLRETTVNLPEGFTINPGAADGKSACTEEQGRFGLREAPQCPEFAKIGTLSIESTTAPAPLPGALYLGEPLSGNRYRVFLFGDGFGVHLKQIGTVTPDPETGQLEINFKDLPQSPFQLYNLHVFGAERGLLTTPEQCGTYAVRSEFVPWAHQLPDQSSTQFFEIDSGPGGGPCPPDTRPFSPEIGAGVTDNTGGHHTEFVFDLQRDDGEQNLSGLEVSTPPGFSAVLKGIPYCPEATLASLAADGASGASQLASPACSASVIGTSYATAGAGSRPLTLPGTVYLAGPHKGAPLSLAVVTPAVSGPYDLGNVVVRAAIEVHPNTAQITTVSDPLPQIVEGIPLRLRRVVVMLDRENFALNPTNCAPFSVDAEVSGDEGGVENLSRHFQVANCGVMDFAPRLGIRLRGSARRNAHPSLQAVLRPNEGEANIARAAVTLPRTTLLDQGNLTNICTRQQFANRNCPRNSIYGRAAAVSPLLDKALRGPVYLRSNGGARQLPDLVADLRGQVDFELVGFVDSANGGLRTIFSTVPDVPVSKFVIRLQGGARKGLIANSTNLCRNPARFRSVMRAQNGRRQVTRPKLRVACGKSRKAKRKARRASISLARKAVNR